MNRKINKAILSREFFTSFQSCNSHLTEIFVLFEMARQGIEFSDPDILVERDRPPFIKGDLIKSVDCETRSFIMTQVIT